MKNKFLRMAGVESEQEFYDMFPTEEAFFEAYPEATQMKKGGNVPTNKALYSRVKSEAKRKFDRWPSAYGSAWLVREYKKRGGKYRKGQFGGMMGGLNPENPFAGAVSNVMQQQQQQGQDNSQLLGAAMKFAPMLMGMPPMADGGKMPAWLAEKRFKAAGNADKLDDYGYMYGGDVEMGYGGNMDYMQDGGSMEEQMMAAGRQMAPRRSDSELYSGMPSEAKYNTLYDAVRALGFNPSFTNRKKLFNDMFDGAYRGTAEQNTELLRKINSGELDLETLGSKTPAKKSRGKAKKQEAPSLEDKMMEAGRSMTSTPSSKEMYDALPKEARKEKSPSSQWYTEDEWDKAYETQKPNVSSTEKNSGDWYTTEQWDNAMESQGQGRPSSTSSSNDWYTTEEWDRAMESQQGSAPSGSSRGSSDWYTTEEWDNAMRNYNQGNASKNWYTTEQWDAAMQNKRYGGYMQDGGEPDGEMALGQLMSIMDKARSLRKFIGEDADLEPWVSSKLTMADDYIDGVSDYMMYSEDDGMDLEVEEDGGEYSMGELEEMKKGGIPTRYKNMGFTKVGVKKKSNRKGKKWMVLAKKGNKYKVVHGGYTGMKDFSQHGSKKRKDRFWDRMGGKNSAKAKDPFSPLYWHKKFGTWQEGGEIPMVEDMSAMYNPYEMMKKGGIYIDPAKRGTFKAQATKMGMGVQEAANTILNAPEGRYSPEMRRKANFARNFAKQEGGQIMMGDTMELDDNEIQRLMDMGYGVEYID